MRAQNSTAFPQSQDPSPNLRNGEFDSSRLALSGRNIIRDDNNIRYMLETSLKVTAASSSNDQQRHKPVLQNHTSRIEHSQASRKVRTSKPRFIADSEGESEDNTGDG